MRELVVEMYNLEKTAGMENSIMMKVLVACALLILISADVNSAPSKPYVGIFADEAHSVVSVNPATYTSFDVWISFLPSVHGMQATEFRVTMPSNVHVVVVFRNPIMLVTLGCPPPGESYECVVFGEGTCATEWVWTHRLTCLLMDPAPGVIEILPPREGESAIAVYNCEAGYPAEPATILNKFGINQDAVIAVEPQTWGAIKSLYR